MKTLDQKKEPVFIKKRNINYVLDGKDHIKKYKPWLGDVFSFLYERIMEKSIFPKKFNADINRHFEILTQEFKNIHHANILEIVTGSGNAINFLNKDNIYTGIDISPGLLRMAHLKFKKSGFERIGLYIAPADDLPFHDHIFDIAICHLSMNFFDDIELFIQELKRILKIGATFYCSVPVPERKPAKSKIRGILYSENELKALFEHNNFHFESKSYNNGALLYFTACLLAG